MGWVPFGPEERKRCLEWVERALARAGNDATILAVCADVLVQGVHDYARGMELARHAVETNPNDLTAVSAAGVIHLHCGSVEEALRYFERAIRLSPRDPNAPWPLTGIAHAHMVMGNYSRSAALGGKVAWRSILISPPRAGS